MQLLTGKTQERVCVPSGRVSEVTQHWVHAEQTKDPFFFLTLRLRSWFASEVKPGVSKETSQDVCSIQVQETSAATFVCYRLEM